MEAGTIEISPKVGENNLETRLQSLAITDRFEPLQLTTLNKDVLFDHKSELGAIYTIEKIIDPEDQRLVEFHKLLQNQKNFLEEGVVPRLEELKNELRRNSIDDEKIKSTFAVLKRGEKMIGGIYGVVADLEDNNGNPTSDKVYIGGYTVVEEQYRNQGLGKQLYLTILRDAQKQAGSGLVASIGEEAEEAVQFWDNVGRKRVFIQTGENHWKEYEYTAPALEYESNDGPEEKIESKDHLGIDFFDDNTSRERLMQLILAIASWYEGADLKAVKNKLEADFPPGVKIKYLDGEMIENERTTGAIIDEFVAKRDLSEKLEQQAKDPVVEVTV